MNQTAKSSLGTCFSLLWSLHQRSSFRAYRQINVHDPARQLALSPTRSLQTAHSEKIVERIRCGAGLIQIKKAAASLFKNVISADNAIEGKNDYA